MTYDAPMQDGPLVDATPQRPLVPEWLMWLGGVGWRLLATGGLVVVIVMLAIQLSTTTVSVLVAGIVAATFAPYVMALRGRGWGRAKAAGVVVNVAIVGYLAYDLAVHLWAQTSFKRRSLAMWHAFIEGYRSVRAISPGDFSAAHYFVPVRHIWLMGEYAGRRAEWGTEPLPPEWLEREVTFLEEWEAERLSKQLL